MKGESIRILVVDDEDSLRDIIVQRLNRKGFRAAGCPSGEEALRILEKEAFDVGIFDIRLPAMDGLALLQKAMALESHLQVIMLTGHGTTESAVEAMKMGAYDYLTKPCNLAELEVAVQKAFEKKSLLDQNSGLKRALFRERRAGRIIGESKVMKDLLALAEKVAQSDFPVLIEGESGTGKELIAQLVHERSPRARQPFVAINSGALPASLLESELFGYEKGAFTGAGGPKLGLMESADGGTLFLDEIGEMPLELQVKLLRFLESGEFRRVGDVRLRKVDVRLVAATNRSLEEEIKRGNFREDLYYRLHVIKLTMPPLRERKEDIPLLVEHILRQRGVGQELEVDPKAMEILMDYSYPGNVRELYNIMERAILLAEGGSIGIAALPAKLSGENEGGNGGMGATGTGAILTLEEVERRHIERVLRHFNWNKTRAAQALGISLRNLYRKIEGFGLANGK